MWEDLFSQDDIQQERTSGELNQWLTDLFENLENAKGGKEAVRLRNGLCKPLVEEILPLKIWSNHLYPDENNIKFEPVLGNQNYDAFMRDYSVGEVIEKKVEITQAHEGENEYYRRLLLHHEGSAPAFGEIKKTGTKNKDFKLEPKLEAVSHEKILTNIFMCIENAIKNKVSKKYDENTLLVIMFEDLLIFKEEDVTNLNNFIEVILEKTKSPFSEIYLAAWSGRILLRF